MREEVIKRMNSKNLSKYACKDDNAIKLIDESDDLRPRFFRDSDRIIYSLSYTRYIDKTQVFTFTENDNISKRITHVQFVSKIARTIGRALGLNEDLIEAASLGHDLGHPPFGHCGEKALNKLSLENGEGVFAHNAQSVRTLMYLENNGKGNNISIQVLDAILCHNGEIVEEMFSPNFNKTKEDFLGDYDECFKTLEASKKLRPMTLEACVVRISDKVAYAGKDVEDALRLGIISRKDIPKEVIDVLGETNAEIVNTLVLDIINNSFDKPYIKMSKRVYNALDCLIKFNYDKIYNVINASRELKYYQEMYDAVFYNYKMALEKQDKSSDIYKVFLNDMSDEYLNKTTNARKVIDYMSGMTDDYFINRYNEIANIKVKR